ncbi:MAG: SAM-dependent methyltransferase [Hyphomicrobiales bacterium]|nr:SAM-dependent methyltransferase [Hyphomicrobiales bacterium]
MEKDQRNAISSAAQGARGLLEEEYLEQLQGLFDVLATGEVADPPGAHLTASQRVVRAKIVAALDYYRSAGHTPPESVARLVREAAFTTLNRFVALKMLEARDLVQQCLTLGPDSSGYREFAGLAPGLEQLSDNGGYRLYLECLLDELATEVAVLFDRRDHTSLLWPRHNAFQELLAALNAEALDAVWESDETIGWFYQFFNSKDERQQMRDESQAPRNSRELAVRNQFFTPRYVVEFLVDNTLGRTWSEMTSDRTELLDRCDYFVELEDERPERPLKDPRDLRVLDPACGSGHFLLYSFDLLEAMYREAWEHQLGASEGNTTSLRQTYESLDALNLALPALIVEQNLHGIDIDPRAAQIAALALWMRAQRSWRDSGISAADRPRIRKTGIVVAEPMPGDQEMVDEFAADLQPPLLATLFRQIVASLSLAGEMGYLVRAESELASEISRARDEFVTQRLRPQTLPGFEEAEQGELDLSGIDDDAFFAEAEQRLLAALDEYVEVGSGEQQSRRRLFADDAAHGVALLELMRDRYDVVLMNPPFGAGSLKAKKVFDKAYPRTKNDVYAAFVERGIELLVPHGMLGAITSRTGFFLSSFQKWREEIILDTAPPLVFADLGQGVLDGAMVEVAAYVLERAR